jgi:hypothetical protein
MPVTPRSVVRSAAPWALLAYVLCLYGATSVLQRGLFERDGYYHARVSQLVPDRGFSRSFPWTQLSTWRDGFCDKEVLFHLAMAPFTLASDSAIGGARVFSVLLAATVIGILLWLLRAHGVPWPTWFAALPLASGGLFIARLGMIRSHVLSMALLLVGVHFLLQRRWRALLVLGFVYAWCYTVPFVLVMTAVPFAAGCWLTRGGFDWRSIGAAGGGAVLGLAIHPYSPLTFETTLTLLQILRLGLQGAGTSGFELGNEIYPYPLPVLWDIYPLLIVLSVALVAVVALRRRALSAEAVGISVAATCWFGMTLASARFVEYQVLLLALAVGFVVRDLVRGEGPEHRAAVHPRIGPVIALVAVALLVGFHVRSMRFYYSYQSRSAPARYFDGAGKWMARHLEPGETVINLFWDDFPDLFYSAPRQHYLWGLDPTFSIRFDPKRALTLERARQHLEPLDGNALKTAFQSKWIVLRASRAGRYPELRNGPFVLAYRDASAVIYEIEE